MEELEPSWIELYPKLYPIRYLLGFVGAVLLMYALRHWHQLPLKTGILMLIAGLTLIFVTFALKREYLKRNDNAQGFGAEYHDKPIGA